MNQRTYPHEYEAFAEANERKEFEDAVHSDIVNTVAKNIDDPKILNIHIKCNPHTREGLESSLHNLEMGRLGLPVKVIRIARIADLYSQTIDPKVKTVFVFDDTDNTQINIDEMTRMSSVFADMQGFNPLLIGVWLTQTQFEYRDIDARIIDSESTEYIKYKEISLNLTARGKLFDKIENSELNADEKSVVWEILKNAKSLYIAELAIACLKNAEYWQAFTGALMGSVFANNNISELVVANLKRGLGAHSGLSAYTLMQGINRLDRLSVMRYLFSKGIVMRNLEGNYLTHPAIEQVLFLHGFDFNQE